MSKVAQAANKIVKLPEMPPRQYSIALTSLVPDSTPSCCILWSWSRLLARRTAVRNFKTTLTKLLESQLGFNWIIGEFDWPIWSQKRFAVASDQGNLAQRVPSVREEQVRKHSSPGYCSAKMSWLTWLCTIVYLVKSWSEEKYFDPR